MPPIRIGGILHARCQAHAMGGVSALGEKSTPLRSDRYVISIQVPAAECADAMDADRAMPRIIPLQTQFDCYQPQCVLFRFIRTDEKLPAPDPKQLNSWLEGVARKDRDAFRLLYDATAPKLFGFVLHILTKREIAEEVLQDSFVSIWNNASGYQSTLAAPMTWMTAIVRNKAFDVLRRSEQTIELDAGDLNDSGVLEAIEALESTQPTPVDALQHSEEAAALAKCFSRLELVHQQAIALAFYHDLSHREVAERLKLPTGTVKTWIRRGLEKLKLCLTRMGGV